MAQCSNCGCGTEGWKCDMCGAEAEGHVEEHGCGGDHCIPKCSGCGEAQSNCGAGCACAV